MQRIQTFVTALLGAIQETFVESFGENGAKAVMFYVDPTIAVNNIEEYSKSLHKILGDGAQLLEEKIAEKFCAKLNISFQMKEDYRLPQYVEEARQRYLSPA